MLNTKIQDTKYSVEGNIVHCELTLKINLKNFEEKFFGFTQSFIKNDIGKYLPILKTVCNYNHSDENPVVARYYIMPDGTAKVLAYNRQYYKRLQKLHIYNMKKLAMVGDIIPAKYTAPALGETEYYDYCTTFRVTGKATCHPNDKFNEKIGKILAYGKAISKAINHVERLYETIWIRVGCMSDTIKTQYNNLLNLQEAQSEMELQLLKKLGNQ